MICVLDVGAVGNMGPEITGNGGKGTLDGRRVASPGTCDVTRLLGALMGDAAREEDGVSAERLSGVLTGDHELDSAEMDPSNGEADLESQSSLRFTTDGSVVVDSSCSVCSGDGVVASILGRNRPPESRDRWFFFLGRVGYVSSRARSTQTEAATRGRYNANTGNANANANANARRRLDAKTQTQERMPLSSPDGIA